MISLLRKHFIRSHARQIGSLGGKASANKRREPIRARTQQMRREMGLADDWRLA